MSVSPPNSSGSTDRVGPRPLGLHLATAALSWTGAALPGGAWLNAVKGTDPVAESLALVLGQETDLLDNKKLLEHARLDRS